MCGCLESDNDKGAVKLKTVRSQLKQVKSPRLIKGRSVTLLRNKK